MVLAVGIDWAQEFHLVALGRPDEGVFDVRRIDHSPVAVAGLVARIGRLEPDAAGVRVVLETRHGHLVEALVDAGFTVLPVNPDLVARRRNPARKKDDAEDARICCLIALERHIDLRALIPHGETAAELRSIARDDVRPARPAQAAEPAARRPDRRVPGRPRHRWRRARQPDRPEAAAPLAQRR